MDAELMGLYTKAMKVMPGGFITMLKKNKKISLSKLTNAEKHLD